jgi:hypothetical protein
MAQNIFTEELSTGLTDALEQRVQANLMNNHEKINEFILYKNGKMPWIKLQSSVNHHGDVADGTSIAQRWVLRSLFTNKEASFVEYQERNQLEAYNYTGDFGYRPLPGIESATITTLQPLGSLRQAVINYKCWTKGQLENLERLYMRPGFSCLLEWGWSYYLDDNNDLKSITDGVNYFDTSQSEQQIIDKIDKIKKDTNYHYDGMIGFVKNFSWKLRQDGGYDCSTTLISKGELISSMTVNVSSFALDTKTTPMSKFSFKNGASGKNYGMFKFQALTNTSGYEGKDEDEEINDKPSTGEDGDSTKAKENYKTMLNYQYAKSILSGIFYELAAFSDIDDNRSGIDYQKFAASNSDFPSTDPIPVVSMKLKNDYSVEISRKEGSVGEYAFGSIDEKKFIYLKDLIRLINNYAIFHYKADKSKNSKPIFRINTGNITCKYHPLVISSNYDVCFVKPSPLVFDKISNLSSRGDYTDPEVLAQITKFSNYLNKDFGPGQDYKIFDFRKDDSHANASHILINLHFLYSKINDALLQSESDSKKDSGINLASFISSILTEISSKLGGMCNLEMIFDDTRGICKIIDTNLLVEISKAKKVELDQFSIPIFGERSIVKNVGVESRIFAEQATMISIAAQVGGGTQYGLDSTVMGIYNDGLTDRFFTVKDHKINLKDSSKIKESKEEEKEIEYNKMTEAGAKYVDYFLQNLPRSSEDQENPGVVLDDSYLKNLLRFVESRNQYNQAVKNSKILPLNLGLTFDGISGFLIGNILNLENNVIPEPFASSVHSYNDKTGKEDKNGLYKKYIRDVDYYFAITGIDHSINTGGWLTNIKTNYVLYNKDDKRFKTGTQYSPKDQIDKVFQGDILVMGFGATTLEHELNNNLSAGKKLPPGEALSDPMIEARALFFAELFRDLSNTRTSGKRFSTWDIICIIGNAFYESLLSPTVEQRPFIYKGIWSGAGYGLIQFDVNQLRQPLMGNDGKGTNWFKKFDLNLNEIEAHKIWNFNITNDGYLGLRPLINSNLNNGIGSINNFIQHFENYQVIDRRNGVTSKYHVPQNFKNIIDISDKVSKKYSSKIIEMGFFNENNFKQFIYQIEYIYTLFVTPGNSYFTIPLDYVPSGDNNKDFKDSYKKITRSIVGGGKEAETNRMKKCDQIRDLINRHPELKFGPL